MYSIINRHQESIAKMQIREQYNQSDRVRAVLFALEDMLQLMKKRLTVTNTTFNTFKVITHENLSCL